MPEVIEIATSVACLESELLSSYVDPVVIPFGTHVGIPKQEINYRYKTVLDLLKQCDNDKASMRVILEADK